MNKYEYLNDTDFLYQLDRMKIKTQYIKITVLSFDEKPIKEIQGSISSGSITVNGSSRIRRTISLSMIAEEETNNLEDIDNLISINKKISIEVGYKNPFKEYKQYGDIIWFKCGVFVISSASLSRGTNGCTISISGKDKMVLLDGSVGGTLPASTTFSEIYNYQDDDSIIITYPTIFQIIKEAVNHIGIQPIHKIIINDLNETAKMQVKYIGDDPLWMNKDTGKQFIISAADPTPGSNLYDKYVNGDDVGYMETDFTYPGELTLSAGESIVNMLDKIISILGNYEYFFDLDGNFVFQEIRNFLNISYESLYDLKEYQYLPKFSDNKYKYALTDAETVISYNKNPKYDNFKNDFIVWGIRKTPSGKEVGIRYHLAIENKPLIDLARMYMWRVIDKENYKKTIRYEFTLSKEEIIEKGFIIYDKNSKEEIKDNTVELIGKPVPEGDSNAAWREELYRQALEKSLHGVTELIYDEELLAEWRYLYDTMNENWEDTHGWNPDVFSNPGKLNYWLEFIDSEQDLIKYSAGMIGRRTKVINDSNIKTIYNKEVPDVIFLKNTLNEDTNDFFKKIKELNNLHQNFCLITEQQENYFTISTTGVSCFDKIRELLYQNLVYNTTIQINCSPKYYFEPNNIIHIYDKESNINGDYVITQFTLPLDYSGNMSITASEVLTRV